MKKKLIFLHIPKSGGTTFNTILERYYDKDEIFAVGYDKNNVWNIHELETMPTQRKKEINLIRGHLHVGVHKHFEEDFRYITFIRHPVRRTISFYNYVKRIPNHRLYEQVKDMSLLECITQVKDHDVINGQVNRLCGFTGDEDKMLEQTFKNIDKHFDLIGLQEYYDESLILLQHKLDWQNVQYERQNVTLNKKNTITDEMIAEITKMNRLDLILYEKVKEKFLEELNQISNLEQKVKLFKIANKTFTI